MVRSQAAEPNGGLATGEERDERARGGKAHARNLRLEQIAAWEEAGQSSRYYQVNYRTYAPGTAVQAFTRAALEAGRPAVERVNKALQSPPDDPQGQPVTAETENGTRGEHSLALPAGASAVRRLELRVPTSQSERALRSLIVRMECDGERTVWCPASDFFGSGVGLSRVESWYRTVDTNGTVVCRWVMPYQKTAKLTLELNLAEQPLKVALCATVSPWSWDDLAPCTSTRSGITKPVW